MRVHVFLFTFLAVSTLTRGVPVPQDAVGGPGGMADQIYGKNLYSNAPPVPGNSEVQGGEPNKDGNVYMAVSKWTLEMLYDFINRLYEKLKVMVSSNSGGRNVPAYPGPNQENSDISEEDLRNLYTVLYVLYSLIQANAITTFPGEKPVSVPLPVVDGDENYGGQPSTVVDEDEEYYPQIGVGTFPMAYANAKASNNRKRSYGSQLPEREQDIIKKMSRNMLSDILEKLNALFDKKEAAKAGKNVNEAKVVPPAAATATKALAAEEKSKTP